MTIDEKNRYLQFLRAKIEILAGCLDPSQRQTFGDSKLLGLRVLNDIEASRLSLQTLKEFDQELELFPRMAIGPAGIRHIVAELKKQFGFGRLAEDPDVVIKRVLRRKKIANDRELRVILDVLACVDDSLDPPVRDALDDAARRYEGLDQWGPIKRIDT